MVWAMSAYGDYGDAVMNALIAAAQDDFEMSAGEAMDVLGLDLMEEAEAEITLALSEVLDGAYSGLEETVWAGDEEDDELS